MTAGRVVLVDRATMPLEWRRALDEYVDVLTAEQDVDRLDLLLAHLRKSVARTEGMRDAVRADRRRRDP